LVKFFEEGTADPWVAYKLVLMFVIKQLLEVSIQQYCWLQFHNRGHLACNILMNYSLQKQMKLSGATNKNFDKGEIISVLEHSCYRINQVFELFHHALEIPLMLITSMVSIYTLFGHTMWIGVSILTITMTLSYYMNKYIDKKGKKQREINKKRINYTTEALSNIKALKFYNWTDVFANLIQKTRVEEHNLDTLMRFWRIIVEFVNSVFPGLMHPLTAVVYVYYNSSMSLFMSTRLGQLLGNIHWSFWMINMQMNRYQDLIDSMDKLENFYALPEIDQSKMIASTHSDSDTAIAISKKSFTWGVKTKTDKQLKKEAKEKKEKEE